MACHSQDSGLVGQWCACGCVSGIVESACGRWFSVWGKYCTLGTALRGENTALTLSQHLGPCLTFLALGPWIPTGESGKRWV